MKAKIKTFILKVIFTIIIVLYVIMLIIMFSRCTAPQYCHTYKSASYDANHRAYSLKHDKGVNPVFPRKKY
jgi:hypothetical protein